MYNHLVISASWRITSASLAEGEAKANNINNHQITTTLLSFEFDPNAMAGSFTNIKLPNVSILQQLARDQLIMKLETVSIKPKFAESHSRKCRPRLLSRMTATMLGEIISGVLSRVHCTADMPQCCGCIRIFSEKICINPYHSNIPHAKYRNIAQSRTLSLTFCYLLPVHTNKN